jgi:hypothetical protein
MSLGYKLRSASGVITQFIPRANPKGCFSVEAPPSAAEATIATELQELVEAFWLNKA